MPDYASEFSNLNVHNVLAAISYVSKHAFYFFFPLLEHVPAQGGERNAKGLLKRRSLEKIKFLQQFWSTAAVGAGTVFMWGGAAPSGFSVEWCERALEVFCGGGGRERCHLLNPVDVQAACYECKHV